MGIKRYKIESITCYHLILALIAALSLIMAFIAEYQLGILPCDLCIVQRYSYGSIGAVSLLAIIVRVKHKIFLFSSLLTILAGLGLSIFHSGLERHFFIFESKCTGHFKAGDSIEQMMLAIEQAPIAQCNAMGPLFLGLTMANWGMLLLICLLIFNVLVIRLKIMIFFAVGERSEGKKDHYNHKAHEG